MEDQKFLQIIKEEGVPKKLLEIFKEVDKYLFDRYTGHKLLKFGEKFPFHRKELEEFTKKLIWYHVNYNAGYFEDELGMFYIIGEIIKTKDDAVLVRYYFERRNGKYYLTKVDISKPFKKLY